MKITIYTLGVCLIMAKFAMSFDFSNSVTKNSFYKTSPHTYLPPIDAGPDRSVMLNGKTYLSAIIRSKELLAKPLLWAKLSGPGKVSFSDDRSQKSTATFSAAGEYMLSFTAGSGDMAKKSVLKVKVLSPPPPKRLDVVYTRRYKIDSKLWNDRAKSMIVNWIPFCIDQCERTNLTVGMGGIDNFIAAGRKLRRESYVKHKGYVFSNAWVHQTVEAMCEALMIDPQG